MVKKVFSIISTVILVILVALVVFIFAVRLTGKSPSIFGYHIFRVSSGSMEPTLAIGEVILDKEVPVSEIHEGDIISYNGTRGDFDGKVITHKVITEPYKEDGEWYLQTMGIAEGCVPDYPITYDQVEGKYICSLPFIDKVYTFFLSPYGLIVFVFIIVALFGYEMISLILSYRHIDEYDEEYYAPKNKKKSKKRKKK